MPILFKDPSSIYSRIAVVYVLWSQEHTLWLPDALKGMADQTYPKEAWEIVMIYNSFRPGETSAIDAIREKFLEYKEKLPHYTILDQPKNWGFSGGYNIGMRYAIEHDFQYVFLHNGDGEMGPQCLEKMVSAFEKDKNIGVLQPLILLDPEKHLINTSGNCYHYLGLGYSNQYKEPKSKLSDLSIHDVGYASGAAVMMRTELLEKFGLWDEDYFLYHEDTDYSLRLRIHGYRIVLAPEAEFFHKYQWKMQNYYWIERNRFAVLLLFYTKRTLLLLIPILLTLELGMLFFAIKNGYFVSRLRIYTYWLNPKNLRLWLSKRKRLQAIRKISDAELLRYSVAEIAFQNDALAHSCALALGNVIMRGYWKSIRRFI
jgi:GT2 family glycosyltransferase